jgi:hypothetical protein
VVSRSSPAAITSWRITSVRAGLILPMTRGAMPPATTSELDVAASHARPVRITE